MEITSHASSDDAIKASGHDIPKCVRRSGQTSFQIRAVSNEVPESSCVHDSFVRKLERDGPSSVTVCQRARANAYPSPVDPV